MPQMAPLNWLNLFIMMIIMMNMLSTLNYFYFLNKFTHKKLYKKNKYIWKW